jgi:hypothetical protein
MRQKAFSAPGYKVSFIIFPFAIDKSQIRLSFLGAKWSEETFFRLAYTYEERTHEQVVLEFMLSLEIITTTSNSTIQSRFLFKLLIRKMLITMTFSGMLLWLFSARHEFPHTILDWRMQISP